MKKQSKDVKQDTLLEKKRREELVDTIIANIVDYITTAKSNSNQARLNYDNDTRAMNEIMVQIGQEPDDRIVNMLGAQLDKLLESTTSATIMIQHWEATKSSFETLKREVANLRNFVMDEEAFAVVSKLTIEVLESIFAGKNADMFESIMETINKILERVRIGLEVQTNSAERRQQDYASAARPDSVSDVQRRDADMQNRESEKAARYRELARLKMQSIPNPDAISTAESQTTQESKNKKPN